MLVNCFIKRYFNFLCVLIMIDFLKLYRMGVLLCNGVGGKFLLKLMDVGPSIRDTRVVMHMLFQETSIYLDVLRN